MAYELGWLTADRVVESARQSQSAHQRFINSTLNLWSLMQKFQQHLIKDEMYNSSVPASPLSLLSTVRKLMW